MAINPSNIEDLHGGLTETLTEFSFKATRTVKVPWADRITIANQLVGTSSFASPVPALTYPSMPSARAKEVSIKGQGLISGGNCSDIDSAPTYEYAILTIQYDTDGVIPGFPEVPSGYMTYRSNLGGHYFTLPGRHLRWADVAAGGEPKVAEDVIGAKYQPVTTHIFTWNKCPAPPWAAIRASRGTVNDAAFGAAFAEQVLFEGAQVQTQFQLNPTEPLLWQLTYNFQERAQLINGIPVGWNHTFREDPAGWVRLLTEDGNPLYASTNFALLFQLA